MNRMGLQNPFSPFNFDRNTENISNSDSKNNSESSDLKTYIKKWKSLKESFEI